MPMAPKSSTTSARSSAADVPARPQNCRSSSAFSAPTWMRPFAPPPADATNTQRVGRSDGTSAIRSAFAPGPECPDGVKSETNVTTERWSAVEWIADADLTRASFYWDSVPHCRNPPRACQVRRRAIPCSDCAKQRHDIIPNRLALPAEESVSGVTGATAQADQETPHAHLHHWQ